MSNLVEVRVPARLHLSVFDMNQFSLGKAGGGGVGLAIKLYTTTVVKKVNYCGVIKYDRANIIQHFIDLMKKKLNYSENFYVNIQQDVDTHAGFGSTSSAVISFLIGVNLLFDSPFSNEELVHILKENMVEEDENGNLVKCFETGVGPWTNILGGLVVVDNNCNLIGRIEINKAIALIIPNKNDEITLHSEENYLISKICKQYETEDYDKKQKIINNQLIPGLANKQFDSILEAINKIKYLGSKRAEIEFVNKKHDDFVSKISSIAEKHNLINSMSSIGTCVALIGDLENIKFAVNQIKKIQDGLKIIDSQIDNTQFSYTYF